MATNNGMDDVSAARPAPHGAGRPRRRAGGAGSPRAARRTAGRAGRPLPQGDKLYTPGAAPGRRTIERSSARPLVLLHQFPPWLAPLVLVALLVAGLALRGWAGAAALVLVAAFLGWLGYISWPALPVRGRLLRGAAIIILLALAVVQATR